jgi:hypothetical protein
MGSFFKRKIAILQTGQNAYLKTTQYLLSVSAILISTMIKSRWSPLALWAAAMGLLGCFLYASYCGRTQVDIVATSESLALKISDLDVNWPPIKISSLEVITPAQIDGDIDRLNSASAEFSRIAFDGIGTVLDLQSFKLAQNDTLSIRHLTGTDNLFEFIVTPDPAKHSNLAPTELTLIIFGTFKLDVAEAAPRTLTSGHPNSVKVSMYDSKRVFRLKLAESELLQSAPFQVSAISFFDTIEQTRPSPFSTIKDGSIRFEQVVVAAGNKEKQLRSGEPLQIGALENGYIRTVRLSDKGIYVGYFGDVLGLESVWRDYKSNLMPTRFERWASDPAVMAYATLIATILGVIAAGMALVDGN